MKNALTALAALALCGSHSIAVAADDPQSIKLNMKPGLWEQKTVFQGEELSRALSEQTQALEQAQAQMYEQMQETMKSLPPEERKQMEAMLKQQGIDVSKPAEGMPVELDSESMISESLSCITQKEIDDGFQPELDEDCDTEVKKMGAARLYVTSKCTDETSGMVQLMDGEFELVSPKQYVGTMVMSASGETEAMTGEVKIEGRWLDSDCGEVKPEQ